jgi:argininosuccinate synthase
LRKGAEFCLTPEAGCFRDFALGAGGGFSTMSAMKIVLAYSGGLDTSVILSWLKEKYQAEIIAFTANIGQGEELKGLDKKARQTGASKLYVEDLQEEFARDFIYPIIQAGAIYENQYLLGTSIARPLIAKRMVEIALAEKADAIAHGATGKGNDQVRFELTAAALAPELQAIAPWRDSGFRDKFPGRAEMIQYCEEKKIPVAATAKKPYSTDRNLLHISFEAGILEDPWLDASAPQYKDMYKLSVSPEDAPDKPKYITLDFERGEAVAVNGKRLSPLGVMQALNKLGGKHGIGRPTAIRRATTGALVAETGCCVHGATNRTRRFQKRAVLQTTRIGPGHANRRRRWAGIGT